MARNGTRAYDAAALALATVLAGGGSSEASLEHLRLDNQASVVVAPQAGATRAALQIWFAAGAVHEGPERAGLAHLVEHLMFRRMADVDGMGAILSARTTHDYVAYSLDVAPEQVRAAIAVLSAPFVDPGIRQDEFDRERKIVLRELAEREQDQRWSAIEDLHHAVFAEHAYGRRVLGTRESIGRLRRANAFDFVAEAYCGARAVLVAAGNVAVDIVADAAHASLAGLPTGAAAPAQVAPIAASGSVAIAGEIDGARHLVGLPAPASYRQGPELEVLMAALTRSADAARRGVRWAQLFRHRAASLAVIGASDSALAAKLGSYPADWLDRVGQMVSSADIDASSRRLAVELEVEEQHPELLAAGLARDALYVGSRSPKVARRSGQASFAKVASGPASRVHHATLKNGVRVVVWQRGGPRLVAARLLWAGGTALEDVNESGSQHLLAASIAGAGCGEYSTAEVKTRLADAAGSLEGSVGTSTLGLRGLWASSAWRVGLDLMVQCALRPRFEEQPLELRRRRVVHLLSQPLTDEVRAHSLAVRSLFGDRAFGRSLRGTGPVLARLTRRDLAGLHARHYQKQPMVLVVVGDVQPKAVLSWATAELGSLAMDSPRAATPARRRDGKPLQMFEAASGEQASVAVGFRGPNARSPERHAQKLVAAMLDRRGGALYRDLVSSSARAYDVAATAQADPDHGFLVVRATANPSKVAGVIESIRTRTGDLVAGRFSESDLANAAEVLIGQHERGLQRWEALADAIAFQERLGLGYREILATPKSLRAVDKTQIVQFAKRYLTWDRAAIGTVAPRLLSPEAARRARGVRRRQKPSRRHRR